MKKEKEKMVYVFTETQIAIVDLVYRLEKDDEKTLWRAVGYLEALAGANKRIS